MAKKTTEHVCTECGAVYPTWLGKCSQCQSWGTVEERTLDSSSASVGTKTKRASVSVKNARSILQSAKGAAEKERISTGVGEFDRVLGGGMIPGGVVLLTGAPGCGKSTLTLSVAHKVASRGKNVLIASAEETEHQIANRATRIGADSSDNLYVVNEDNLTNIIAYVEELKPELLIVDSLQTVASPDVESSMGSVSQVKEVSNILTKTAKTLEIPTIIIGHVTKDGNVAGPKTAEHVVDTVLSFEASGDSSLRFLRSMKNRFGSTDEVGCFEHVDNGLEEVLDPSGVFLDSHEENVSGVGVSIVMEGNRPIPVEIQSLVVSSSLPVPRRVTSGLDPQRTIMVSTVAEKHAKVALSNSDVYVSSMGGIKIKDTGVDVATIISLASSKWGYAIPSDIVGIGEVSLTGEIRKVPYVERRLEEAHRLGFSIAIISDKVDESKLKKVRDKNLTIVKVKNVSQLVGFIASLGKR